MFACLCSKLGNISRYVLRTSVLTFDNILTLYVRTVTSHFLSARFTNETSTCNEERVC